MIEKQNRKLGEILLEYGMISPEKLKKALKVQKEKGKRIGQILIARLIGCCANN